MDKIDNQIIRLLKDNSKLSATEIALAVNRSRTAVTDRVDKLIANGEITRFTISLREKNIKAFFEIKLKIGGRCLNVAPIFAEKYPATRAWSIAGATDLILLCEGQTLDELDDMRNLLLSFSDVATVDTHAITKSFQ